MSFTRNKDNNRVWNDWKNANRDSLVAIGMPHSLFDDEKSWLYFLDHGYFTRRESDLPLVDIDQMSGSEITSLCEFLEHDTYYPNSSTLGCLQRLMNKGDHS